MEYQSEDICRIIMAAERDAAKIMLGAREIAAESKNGKRDIVTEYDRIIQARLVAALGQAVPGAAFYCEECSMQDRLDAERIFIIDPIDGTMNFAHGMNHSCISVAYMCRGMLLSGAVYNPYLDEMFSAVQGGGAFLNGQRIHTADCPLSDGLVLYGTAPYYSELADRGFRIMRRAFDASLDLRRQGAAALDMCNVAAGRAAAYFEMSVSLWDYAAGALILQEAGGVCMSLEGKSLPFDGQKSGIIAGAAPAAAELLALTRE